ncbi:Golgi-associated plant pathogenesis-related protein 1-like [Xenentodon cancila]
MWSDESFQQEFLDAHNAYRAMHKAPPLTLNSELSAAAQKWADCMLENNFLSTSDTDDGELTFSMQRYKSFKPTGKEAVEWWYNNIKNYNFSKPDYQSNTGSFTQVVWRDTRELGVGMASDGVRTFVVGQYRPNGNVIFEGSFQKNVLPKGEVK